MSVVESVLMLCAVYAPSTGSGLLLHDLLHQKYIYIRFKEVCYFKAKMHFYFTALEKYIWVTFKR